MFYHALTGNGGTTPTEDLEPVLLWTNPSPTVDFGTQTVSLDLTDYAGVIVEFNANTNTSNYTTCSRVFCKKNDPEYFGGGAVPAGGALGRTVRITDEGVFFGKGFLENSIANGNAVPIKIYGVKKYVVEPVVGDLLWHNDNPTTSLALKEINGDYSKYSKILVKGRYSTTKDFPLESVVFKDSTYYSGLLASTVGVETSYRGVSLTDTKITINANFLFTSGTPTANDIYCIVTDIYGIE